MCANRSERYLALPFCFMLLFVFFFYWDSLTALAKSLVKILLSVILRKPALSFCTEDTDISSDLWCRSDYLRILHFQASLLGTVKMYIADPYLSLSHPCLRMSATNSGWDAAGTKRGRMRAKVERSCGCLHCEWLLCAQTEIRGSQKTWPQSQFSSF